MSTVSLFRRGIFHTSNSIRCISSIIGHKSVVPTSASTVSAKNTVKTTYAPLFSGEKRNSSMDTIQGSYQGDGKTTLRVINDRTSRYIMIYAYNQYGFRLNTGVFVIGPCVLFPKTIFQWNVEGVWDMDERTLAFFTLLEPRLDVLVLGVGDRENISKLPRQTRFFLRDQRINVEVLPTHHAIATYNFLVEEGRIVVGAFTPPEHVPVDLWEDNIQMEQTKRKIHKFTQKVPGVGDGFFT